MRRWAWLIVLAVVLGACGGSGNSEAHAPVATDTVPPPKCELAEHDLTEEPPYTATYLHRFRDRVGCEVRLDVLMLRRPGPDHHCAPWPQEIVLTNPVGVPFPPAPHRIYERDEAEAPMPDGAFDTGYTSAAGRLFVTPEDDGAVYVKTDSHKVERWRRQDPPKGCI